MGCDAFADENGEYEMNIYDYDTGELYGHIQIKTSPKARLILDRLKGTSR
jgi:hypothetical protein